jgi:hypothetical protein
MVLRAMTVWMSMTEATADLVTHAHGAGFTVMIWLGTEDAGVATAVMELVRMKGGDTVGEEASLGPEHSQRTPTYPTSQLAFFRNPNPQEP